MAKIPTSNIKKARGHHHEQRIMAQGGDIDVFPRGTMEQVYGSQVAFSKDPKFNDSFFIVAKKIVFEGRAVGSHYYLVYQYDKDGEFIGEVDSEKLTPDFLNKLLIID